MHVTKMGDKSGVCQLSILLEINKDNFFTKDHECEYVLLHQSWVENMDEWESCMCKCCRQMFNQTKTWTVWILGVRMNTWAGYKSYV